MTNVIPILNVMWLALQGGTREHSHASFQLCFIICSFLAIFATLSSSRNHHEFQPISSSSVKTKRRKKRSAPLQLRGSQSSPQLPPIDISTLLGPTHTWRCTPRKRKKNPPHYYLIKKANERLLRLHGLSSFKKRRFKRRFKKVKKTRDTSRDVPFHWKYVSEEERLEDYSRTKHRFLHHTSVMFDARFGVNLDEFLSNVNPLRQFQMIKELSNPLVLATSTERTKLNDVLQSAKQHATSLNRAFIATIGPNAGGVLPQADYRIPPVAPVTTSQQSVYLSGNSSLPMVIDTGASTISITPNKSDF
eukprot:scaffold3565_cov78-Cylindrotheca_fusiformis.AAC.2